MQEDAVSRVIQYIAGRYHAAPEYLWARSPDSAIFRHQGNRKWFAVLLCGIPYARLGLTDAGTASLLDLKCDPLLAGSLLDGRHYFPAYHMNKEHWITVLLDGTVPDAELFQLIALSYDMTVPKHKPASEN